MEEDELMRNRRLSSSPPPPQQQQQQQLPIDVVSDSASSAMVSEDATCPTHQALDPSVTESQSEDEPGALVIDHTLSFAKEENENEEPTIPALPNSLQGPTSEEEDDDDDRHLQPQQQQEEEGDLSHSHGALQVEGLLRVQKESTLNVTLETVDVNDDHDDDDDDYHFHQHQRDYNDAENDSNSAPALMLSLNEINDLQLQEDHGEDEDEMSRSSSSSSLHQHQHQQPGQQHDDDGDGDDEEEYEADESSQQSSSIDWYDQWVPLTETDDGISMISHLMDSIHSISSNSEEDEATAAALIHEGEGMEIRSSPTMISVFSTDAIESHILAYEGETTYVIAGEQIDIQDNQADPNYLAESLLLNRPSAPQQRQVQQPQKVVLITFEGEERSSTAGGFGSHHDANNNTNMTLEDFLNANCMQGTRKQRRRRIMERQRNALSRITPVVVPPHSANTATNKRRGEGAEEEVGLFQQFLDYTTSPSNAFGQLQSMWSF